MLSSDHHLLLSVEGQTSEMQQMNQMIEELQAKHVAMQSQVPFRASPTQQIVGPQRQRGCRIKFPMPPRICCCAPCRQGRAAQQQLTSRLFACAVSSTSRRLCGCGRRSKPPGAQFRQIRPSNPRTLGPAVGPAGVWPLRPRRRFRCPASTAPQVCTVTLTPLLSVRALLSESGRGVHIHLEGGPSLLKPGRASPTLRCESLLETCRGSTSGWAPKDFLSASL